MNNRGQITIFFSLMISVMMLFTLTALEVGRVYMSRIKEASVVQSVRLNILAEYNRELFERYHLLFLDPTYGTGSYAVLEQKIADNIEISLNGEDNAIYEFALEEIHIVEEKGVLDNRLQLVIQQIEEYEKTAGIVHCAKNVKEKLQKRSEELKRAADETEINGVEIEQTTEESKENPETSSESEVEVTDPRDTMKEALKFGILSFLKPDDLQVSGKPIDFQDAISKEYAQMQETEKDNSFQDIRFWKQFLKKTAKEDDGQGILEKAAFIDYTMYHFSNGVVPKEDTVMKCEVEYILKGKDNDYDNLQAVVNEMIWMRMPVNYAYLLTDEVKKGEALTLAATICTATGTEAFIEVVKYLLLGCWAYGETLCEMRTLLSGKNIAYIKTEKDWMTQLSSLGDAAMADSYSNGISYEDFLVILLAKKKGENLYTGYARILDVIEKNLQQKNETFAFRNHVGELTIQGKISLQPFFVNGGKGEAYDYYFEEKVAY